MKNLLKRIGVALGLILVLGMGYIPALNAKPKHKHHKVMKSRKKAMHKAKVIEKKAKTKAMFKEKKARIKGKKIIRNKKNQKNKK